MADNETMPPAEEHPKDDAIAKARAIMHDAKFDYRSYKPHFALSEESLKHLKLQVEATKLEKALLAECNKRYTESLKRYIVDTYLERPGEDEQVWKDIAAKGWRLTYETVAQRNEANMNIAVFRITATRYAIVDGKEVAEEIAPAAIATPGTGYSDFQLDDGSMLRAMTDEELENRLPEEATTNSDLQCLLDVIK